MHRFVRSAVVLPLLAAAFALPAAAQSASPLTVPVTGAVAGAGNFVGTFTPQTFQYQAGVIRAIGTLAGTVTNAAGQTVSTVAATTISLPITAATGSCPVLHLDLGPLNLDLLGLQVSLNQVVLDITAQAGPGNLLGNLLCAVAHLLDSNASGLAIAQKLNQILASL